MSKRATFLVTAADADSAVLRDVADGQVHPLAANPGVETGDVLEATIAACPPLELTWTVESVADRRSLTVERVDDPPGETARETAAALAAGEMATVEAADGETHVIRVPDERTDEAAADVVADEATRERAASLGATRVTVRAANGVVSVSFRR
jgi:hypothetical protein